MSYQVKWTALSGVRKKTRLFFDFLRWMWKFWVVFYSHFIDCFDVYLYFFYGLPSYYRCRWKTGSKVLNFFLKKILVLFKFSFWKPMLYQATVKLLSKLAFAKKYCEFKTKLGSDSPFQLIFLFFFGIKNYGFYIIKFLIFYIKKKLIFKNCWYNLKIILYFK